MLRYFYVNILGATAAQAASPGSVAAWGRNDYGQTTVPAPAQSGVIPIAGGSDHTVALKTNGLVVAWGRNNWGQTDVPFSAQSGVTAIAAGGYHTLALKTDGSVVSWGSIGYGVTNVPVAAQSGAMAVAAGGYHTVAIVPTPACPAPASLNIGLYAGIDIQGTTGGTYRVEYAAAVPTTNWTVLTNIVLPVSPYFYLDRGSVTSSVRRFYRAVGVCQ